ncbi:hypothetical protein ARALYDRAFT_896293 [Arabidopsis lyrata subsp. lyrata]|uniref:GRF-type domain-containing protein n=1 Tax=Arabidopsis lyrata subsp. lyrata TaxID=81972 RepID=D7L0C7_ARALL|nr:uncharacterized protein At4g04775 [Arabidopsis lyrata subsp. lyrata]EFH58530.1 hypothetical protein ARALYDRAFT_896293 [Arabidopsis lyrata subsp. lyrata]|eukprot:XP_002882271.1 uncharacterized protein At4g04775 [Arabidopsis lyrata subsp. lyrata]
MELSSGSSSSFRSTNGGRKVCDCGLPAKIYKSKTEKNPNRRFFGCQLYKEGGNAHCKFFRWFEEETVKGLPKIGLIEAEAEINAKNKIIDQLTVTIMELREHLERHKGEISSIDSDDEEKESIDIGLKTKAKIDELEKTVYRQRVIITGLTGLLVCAIGVIVCS